MEDIVKVIEVLKEAEFKRMLSLVYAMWTPLGALTAYLMLLTNSLTPLWILVLGIIPYAALVRKMRRIKYLGDKRILKYSIILAVILEMLFGLMSPPLGAAGAVAGWLSGIAIALGKEGILDALAGWGTLALTAIAYIMGLNVIEQWISFVLAGTTCYSAAAIARALEGLYEVLPYVGESRER